ncbi:SGNH/GDSL hydrolase family protein, partial [Klebsiella pneumoniae]|nr:SGNH/GDSL hydrolase family protein [Klebsiella pneumoniae]
MTITETQKTAQLAADAAVSAAEAKQYMLEAAQGYQDTSAAAQQAQDAAGSALLSKQSAATSETNAAQSAEEAEAAKIEAAAAAANASDYAKNKFTFYKTPTDPDGTIAGLAATTDGQSFWVAQGPDALSAAWQYQNKAGVAVLQAKQPGTAAITGTIREFPTLAAAQADADAGNIPVGSTAYYRSPDDSALAIEVINNGGVLTATGRKMPSQAAVDGARPHADAIVENRILPVNTAIAAQVDNDLNTVKHIFNVLQQSISAAVSSILCPQRSAFIINSMSNANAVGVPGGLTAKVAGVVTYQNTILPGE